VAQIEPITHNGQSVLLIDYGGLRTEAEILEFIAAAQARIFACEPKSALLVNNFANTHATVAVLRRLKEFAAQNTPYVRASALIGLTPIQEVLARAVSRVAGRKLPIFETLPAALDWITVQ
jgi:hypothetical protein